MAKNYSTEIINRYDVLHSDLSAAMAIIDAAAVLTALERAKTIREEGSLITGEGFANGYILRDHSLPAMLKHAVSLVDMARNEADCMREDAQEAITMLDKADKKETAMNDSVTSPSTPAA